MPTAKSALCSPAAYGLDGAGEGLIPRLDLIREALQEGDICRAMILALQAQLGPVAPEAIVRMARMEALGKHNFNPDELRDLHGQWTAEGGSFPTGGAGSGGHPALPTAENRRSGRDRYPTQVAQNAPLDFSLHAFGRMRERGITPDQVMDATKNGIRVTQPNGNIRCTGDGCVVVMSPTGRIVTIY